MAKITTLRFAAGQARHYDYIEDGPRPGIRGFDHERIDSHNSIDDNKYNYRKPDTEGATTNNNSSLFSILPKEAALKS